MSKNVRKVNSSACQESIMHATDSVKKDNKDLTIPFLKCYVVIDNVCAWPALTQLRDGTIIAIIHNDPSHGLCEGDVECWSSANGEFWHKVGTPAPHDPDTVRMNVAAGLAGNDDLLVLSAGWASSQSFRGERLRIWVCRSTDGGKNWTIRKDFPPPNAIESAEFPPSRNISKMPMFTADPVNSAEFTPFGNILRAEDGSLRVSCYSSGVIMVDGKAATGYHSWLFRSDDDGQTWSVESIITPEHDETHLLHLGGKSWLAASRYTAVDLFRSDDDGKTWGEPLHVTEKGELNGHLLRLRDGRLLLSYGNRITGHEGVYVKFSRNEGKTWSASVRLADSLSGDCGYPSSVQRADDKIVTAFYTSSAKNHERYHMGVIIWEVPPRSEP